MFRLSATGLLDLPRDFSGTLDADALLTRIETVALRVLDCERMSVFVKDPRHDVLRTRLATAESEIRTPFDKGIAASTFRERRVINVPDVTTDPRFNPAIDQRTGFRTRTLLSVPLIGIDGTTVGALELLNKKSGPFTRADEELAVTMGALTGAALQREVLFEQYVEKQRLDHEVRLARDIQRSLLPAMDPDVPGFDIAGWSQAAHATGGDFYDYVRLVDGRLGLIVGDVAGHGLGSSLLACEARALIRAAATTSEGLQSIIERTNDLLYTDLRQERFVVLFMAALDVGTGRLEFVNAGSMALWRDARGRRPFQLPTTTQPLGMLSRVESVAQADVRLEPGDSVSIVTDGFYEWENAEAEPFGIDRLVDVIDRGASAPAADMIRHLRDAVSSFGVAVRQPDDLTAMVIRRVA